MKKTLLILLLSLVFVSARATHIVGGEFELTHSWGNVYKLTLNLYFDNIYGSPGAIDASAVVGIFEKGNPVAISIFSIPRTGRYPVSYTSIACTNPNLSTDKITYQDLIVLDPQKYKSPNGYYMVNDRCCRNNGINNIVNPGGAGQAFYLEFPAVVQNGMPFINSSPILFPPLSDYACLNDVFYYEFGGKDPDGDSLVYEMVTPLNGFSYSGNARPEQPSAGPYPPINWINGLNTNNQIPGNPSARIDRQSGQFSVRPTSLGLFVFSISCSEYRNNVKIGEVRRDFQLLVLSCPTNTKPKALVKEPGSKVFYQEGKVLKISANGPRCMELVFADQDPDEPLTIEVKPVNFTSSERFISLTQGVVNQGGERDSLKTTACFPACLDSKGKIFMVDFIVGDDGCSLPKKDTVRVSFQIESTVDLPPVITTTAQPIIYRPRIGGLIEFDVVGTDANSDVVSLSVSGQNFPVSGQAITFPPVSGPGRAQSRFSWRLDCRASTQSSYKLLFNATTIICGVAVTTTTMVEVQPDLTDRPPTITTTAPDLILKPKLGQTIQFDVRGRDADNDLISLSLEGQNFNLGEHKITFPANSAAGDVSSRFTWVIDCPAVQQKSYVLVFSVTSLVCGKSVRQTTSIQVQPDYENRTPAITSGLAGQSINVLFGTTVRDTIRATDPDNHPIAIKAAGDGFDLADYKMEFKAGNGNGRAESYFSWTPPCEINQERQQFKVNFTVTETACQAKPPVTISVIFNLVYETPAVFNPANIFTPNNDGLNDYFVLPDLPPDFCSSVFANIEIYNRWGRVVYQSKSRDFQWDGRNVSAGVYYYHITYTDRTYKGMVTLVN